MLTLDAWPGVEPPREVGVTSPRTRAKALYYADATGELTVAEDSGLEIDTMDGAPGVESARYGGADASYPDKFRLIYDTLNAKGALASPARFVCALALAHHGRVLFASRGTIEGHIAPELKGWAARLRPDLLYPPYGRTLRRTAEEKLAVSHRGPPSARFGVVPHS